MQAFIQSDLARVLLQSMSYTLQIVIIQITYVVVVL